MLSKIVRRMVRWFIAPLALVVFSASHSVAAPYLWWKLELRSALTPLNGLSFDMYGSQRQLDVVLTFVNEDSDEGLVLPRNFLQSLRVSAAVGNGRAAPIETRWSGAVLVASGVDYTMSVEESATLWPGDRLEVRGTIVRPEETEFTPGEYELTLHVGPARGLTTADGRPWSGRYEAEGTVNVHVIEPRTPAELRAKRIIDGERALADDDSVVALGHYQALVQADPQDIEARAGLGRAYLQLGRFQQAATEFEAVIPSAAGRRSLVYAWLAHAYVGIGDTARAEALLRQQAPAEAISRQLQALRDDVSRPGRRR